MKKILSILFIAIMPFVTKGQTLYGTPGTSPQSNINQTTNFRGAVQTWIGFIDGTYFDTTSANSAPQNVKSIPFIKIATYFDGIVWERNVTATAWQQFLFLGGIGSIPNWQHVMDVGNTSTDSAIIYDNNQHRHGVELAINDSTGGVVNVKGKMSGNVITTTLTNSSISIRDSATGTSENLLFPFGIADNAHRVVELPIVDPTLPRVLIASINGNYANNDGNINITTGTITGVTAGIDLTGGGTSGTVTLNADTTIGATKLATQGFVQRQGYLTTAVTNLTGVNTNGFTWSIANPSTIPAITLTQQNATTSQSGQLTSTDWNTFNGKLSNITGLVTAGTNVTIGGSGTSGSPYVINSTGGGGGNDSDNIQYIVAKLDTTNNGTAATNNTTAINNDEILAQTEGKGVYIYAGDGSDTFNVNTIEQIISVPLKGSGNTRAVLREWGNNKLLHYSAGTGLDYRMRISDISFYGHNKQNIGWDFHGASNCNFNRVTLENFDTAINLVDPVSDIISGQGIYIANNHTGIVLQSQFSDANVNKISDAIINHNDKFGIDMSGGCQLKLLDVDAGANGTKLSSTTGDIWIHGALSTTATPTVLLEQDGGWMEQTEGFCWRFDSAATSMTSDIRDVVMDSGDSAAYKLIVKSNKTNGSIMRVITHNVQIGAGNPQDTNSIVVENPNAIVNYNAAFAESPSFYKQINGGTITFGDSVITSYFQSGDTLKGVLYGNGKIINVYTPSGGSIAWGLNGNNAASGSSLGTTNATSLRMITNNIERAWIDSVGTGCTNCNMFHIGSRASGNGLSLWNFDNAGTTVLMNGTGTTLGNNFLDFSGSSLLIDNLGTRIITNNNDFTVSAGSSTGSYINSTGLMIGTNTGALSGCTLSLFDTDGSGLNGYNLFNSTGNSVLGSNTDDGINRLQVNGSTKIQGLTLAQKSVSSAYTITVADYYIDVTGVTSVTLPSAVGIGGRTYIITDAGVSVVTLSAAGGETINGSSTQTITAGNSLTIHSGNSTNWVIN